MIKVGRAKFTVNVILVENLEKVDEAYVEEFHVKFKERYKNITAYGIVEKCVWARHNYSCEYSYYYYVFCDSSKKCKLAEVYEKDCISDYKQWGDIIVKFPGEYDDSHSIPPWILAAGVAASRISYREKGWCRKGAMG